MWPGLSREEAKVAAVGLLLQDIEEMDKKNRLGESGGAAKSK